MYHNPSSKRAQTLSINSNLRVICVNAQWHGNNRAHNAHLFTKLFNYNIWRISHKKLSARKLSSPGNGIIPVGGRNGAHVLCKATHARNMLKSNFITTYNYPINPVHSPRICDRVCVCVFWGRWQKKSPVRCDNMGECFSLDIGALAIWSRDYSPMTNRLSKFSIINRRWIMVTKCCKHTINYIHSQKFVFFKGYMKR